MQAIADAPIDEKRLDLYGKPAEDLWIPNVLNPLGMRGYHDGRYWFKQSPLDTHVLTIHLSQGTGNYTPQKMLGIHAEAGRR